MTFEQGLLYRMVYGHIRDQAGRYYGKSNEAELRVDPLRGLNVEPEVLLDTATAELIKEAVEDALAGRKPQW